MNKKLLICSFILVLLSLVPYTKAMNHFSQVHQLEVFTNNGNYCDSSDLDFPIVTFGRGTSNMIDFTIYNESLISSSIAGIYFDFDNLLDFCDLTNGYGVSFGTGARPRELPGGNTLVPVFQSSDTFGARQPMFHKGINPGEWLHISFSLNTHVNISTVIDGMNSGELRIGAHIIGLPDGTSESAVTTTPEPGTILLLGLGSLSLVWKRKG